MSKKKKQNKQKLEEFYEREITIIAILHQEGFQPRWHDGINWISGEVPDELLFDIEKHKRIIGFLKQHAKKIMEWQDLTTNKVFIRVLA